MATLTLTGTLGVRARMSRPDPNRQPIPPLCADYERLEAAMVDALERVLFVAARRETRGELFEDLHALPTVALRDLSVLALRALGCEEYFLERHPELRPALYGDAHGG
jgi:hypothetical protein